MLYLTPFFFYQGGDKVDLRSRQNPGREGLLSCVQSSFRANSCQLWQLLQSFQWYTGSVASQCTMSTGYVVFKVVHFRFLLLCCLQSLLMLALYHWLFGFAYFSSRSCPACLFRCFALSVVSMCVIKSFKSFFHLQADSFAFHISNLPIVHSRTELDVFFMGDETWMVAR